jgi:PhnB protein
MAHPIPEGFHTITPSLIIKGAAEAIDFYKRAFGATELYRMQMPGPDGEQKIGHAELQIGDSRFFVNDEFPSHGAVGPSGSSPVGIFLYVSDADATFNQAVAAGATVTMPLMNMFWGDRFGKLVDPFGHSWAVATHIEDVPPEEIPKRMAASMGKPGCDSE